MCSCCVCFQCVQRCIIRINPARLLYHPSSIQLVAHQTKAPPLNERKRLPSFLEHVYRLFFGVQPKWECRVSLGMVHIHPRTEWQEAGHQLPIQTALKCFFFFKSLTVAKLKEGSEGQPVCLWSLEPEPMSGSQNGSSHSVRPCVIAVSDLDKQLKMALSWASSSAGVHSPIEEIIWGTVCAKLIANNCYGQVIFM